MECVRIEKYEATVLHYIGGVERESQAKLFYKP